MWLLKTYAIPQFPQQACAAYRSAQQTARVPAQHTYGMYASQVWADPFLRQGK